MVRSGREASRQPVIAPERCTGCKSCIRFCRERVLLFDKSSRKVRVNPRWSCRDDCRTCAGLCPNGAIAFPDEEAFVAYLKARLGPRETPLSRHLPV